MLKAPTQESTVQSVSGSARSSNFFRGLEHVALLVALASVSACVREHTLFEAPGSTGGAAGAASEGDGNAGGDLPGTTVGPWTEKTCLQALGQGQTGDPCLGPFSCSGTVQCCQYVAGCKADQLVVTESCDGCVAKCTSDGDCDNGRICEAYECIDCPKDECPATWSPITRNGCNVCVPPNRCKAPSGDPACGDGQVCVAGLSCLSGCKGDLACCAGNQCTSSACTTLEGADCLTVGCPAGSTCKIVGDAVDCKCDDQAGKWTCASPPVNVCVPR